MKYLFASTWLFMTIAVAFYGCSKSNDNAAPAVADMTPPVVLSVLPSMNATGVAVDSKPTVTFSEAMNASTISTSTFVIRQGTATIAGTVAYSGNTATFTPAVPLTAGTVYSGTIVAGVKDLAGNALAANYTWNFTTAAVVADVTTPTVSSVAPASGTTSFAVNGVITATFSEAMNASTLTTSTFTVTQGTTAVSGSVTYSGNTATFTPAVALSGVTAYTVAISTGAKDLAGNSLAAKYSWSFTTATVTAACGSGVQSFSANVFPIVSAKCMPCHGATNPSAGISLTNYAQVKAIGSRLDNTSMYSKMNVDACSIAIIKAWLAQGSLNN